MQVRTFRHPLLALKDQETRFWFPEVEKELCNTTEESKDEPPRRGRKRTYTKQQKLLKGRLRSKQNRLKKKQYVQTLEAKVHQLEGENYRLQNLLIRYRNEKNQETIPTAKDYFEKVRKIQREFEHGVNQVETLPTKTTQGGKLAEILNTLQPRVNQLHSHFLSNMFQIMKDNLLPLNQQSHWLACEQGYSRSFGDIQKALKLSGTSLEDFKRSRDFSSLDDDIIALDPSKAQFEIIKNTLKKQAALKTRFDLAKSHLCEAQKILDTSTEEMWRIDKSMLDSGEFSDFQLLNSAIMQKFTPQEADLGPIADSKIFPTTRRAENIMHPVE